MEKKIKLLNCVKYFIICLCFIGIIGLFLPYEKSKGDYRKALLDKPDEINVKEVDYKNKDVVEISIMENFKMYSYTASHSNEFGNNADWAHGESVINMVITIVLIVSLLLIVLFAFLKKNILIVIFDILLVLSSLAMNYDIKDRGIMPSDNYTYGISYYLFIVIGVIIIIALIANIFLRKRKPTIKEKKEKNNDKEANNKIVDLLKKYWYFLLIIVFAIVLIFLLINKKEEDNTNNNRNIKDDIKLVTSKEDDLEDKNDTYNIARRIIKQFGEEMEIKEYEPDTNKYSYIESVNAYVEGIDIEENDPAFGINKTKSSLEAAYKKKFLEDQYIVMDEVTKGSYLSSLPDYENDTKARSYNCYFNYKNYYGTINRRYKDSFDKIKKEIIAIIDEYDTNDIEKPDSESKIKEYWNLKLEEKRTFFKETLDEFIKGINEKINDAINTADTDKLDVLEENYKYILELNAYDEFKESTNKFIEKYNQIKK